MAYDIYGNPLPHGHCEVHAYIAQPYPCDLCRADQEDNPTVMWQRVALMNDGTRLLITVFDGDPDTMEVAVRHPLSERWGPPLPIEVPR